MFGLSRSTSKRRSAASDFRCEALESRELLATAAFVAPDLSPYIVAALHGRNTGAATIQRMLSSLQGQLNSGPLAALTAGTDTQATFATDVNNLVVGYQASVAQQLSPRFPNITNILTLQGTKVESLIAADEAQLAAGLITPATFQSQASLAINSLNGSALSPLNAPNSAFAQATKQLETQLNLLPPTLATGATPFLTIQQVQTVVNAEAKAYHDALAASLVTHPNVESRVNSAVTTLTNSVANIAAGTPTSESSMLSAAIVAFDQALLDTTGLFGPLGTHHGRRN